MSISNYSPYLPPEVVNGFFPVLGAVQNHLNSVQGCENTVNNLMRGLFTTHTTRCRGIDYFKIESLKDKGDNIYKLIGNSTNSYTFIHLINNECRKVDFIIESDLVSNYDNVCEIAANFNSLHPMEFRKCLHEIVTFPGYAEKDHIYGFKIANRLMYDYLNNDKPSVEHLNQMYDVASKLPQPDSYYMKSNLYTRFRVGPIGEFASEILHAQLGEPMNNFDNLQYLKFYSPNEPSFYAAYRESALNVVNYYKAHKNGLFDSDPLFMVKKKPRDGCIYLSNILQDEDLLDIHEQVIEIIPDELSYDNAFDLYSSIFDYSAKYEMQIKFLHSVLTKKDLDPIQAINHFGLFRNEYPKQSDKEKVITDLLELSKSNEKEKALIKDKLSKSFTYEIHEQEKTIQFLQRPDWQTDKYGIHRYNGLRWTDEDLPRLIANNKISRDVAQKQGIKIEIECDYECHVRETAQGFLEMVTSTLSSFWSGNTGNTGTSSQKVEL